MMAEQAAQAVPVAGAKPSGFSFDKLGETMFPQLLMSIFGGGGGGSPQGMPQAPMMGGGGQLYGGLKPTVQMPIINPGQWL